MKNTSNNLNKNEAPTMADYLENPVVLPCPFCGGEAVLVESLTIKVVGCRNCAARIGSSIDRKQTAEELIAAWNLRQSAASIAER